MKATRFLTPVLAVATLLLLACNAVPTALRKHRLRRDRARLVHELRGEESRALRLREEVHALRHDPFYRERLTAETWNGQPSGFLPWDEPDSELE